VHSSRWPWAEARARKVRTVQKMRKASALRVSNECQTQAWGAVWAEPRWACRTKRATHPAPSCLDGGTVRRHSLAPQRWFATRPAQTRAQGQQSVLHGAAVLVSSLGRCLWLYLPWPWRLWATSKLTAARRTAATTPLRCAHTLAIRPHARNLPAISSLEPKWKEKVKPMKPFDHEDSADAAGTQTPPVPLAGMPRQGAGRHDLRGLADPAAASNGPHDGTDRPSLWTRIKRAFQYGSQGGETN
jgi:hypothetical protein